MLNPQNPEFSRNLGFLSLDDQETINNATVAIAGAGGDGGALAIQLGRMGVGEIRLADPEVFEIENVNRQACASKSTIGVNKARAVGVYISDINPQIKIKVETKGIQPSNIEAFVEGADLVIDETEFTTHAIGVAIARAARAQNVPNLMAMNVGFGTNITTYHPEGKTLEATLGLPEDMPIEEIAKQDVPIQNWLPYLPSYIDLDVFSAVAKGEKSAPSVAPGVSIAAGVAATQAFLNLMKGNNNWPSPVYAPKFLVVDAIDQKTMLTKYPKISFLKSYAKLVLSNKLGLNPKASY